jgi:hypothetical protein
MKSQQRSGDDMTTFPPESYSYDDESAAWATTDPELSNGFVNVARRRPHNQSLNPTSTSSCSIATQSNGLSNDQGDVLGPTLDLLKSPRPCTGLQTVAKIKSDYKSRRREQNRRSQQAYRERQSQYALDLELQVEEMDARVQRLHLENRELLRSLCAMRAKNRILRNSLRECEASTKNLGSNDFVRSVDGNRSQDLLPLSSHELELLYEPFLVVWNLLGSHLPPDSQPQDFATALEHLQAMAISRTRNDVGDEATE